MSRGTTISLFLVDGNPSGIICAYLSNWTGQAVRIPRNLLEKAKTRSEVNRIGVYFLFGFSEQAPDERIVYIGQSDNIYERLVQHTKDESKSFWSDAICFTSKDDNLSKGHIEYLEYELIKLARNNTKYTLGNKNNAKKSSLSEMAIADMDTFIDNIKTVLPTLGYDLLIEPATNREKKNTTFYLDIGGLKATGYLSNNGFVVIKGSDLSLELKESLSMSYKNIREILIEKEVIKVDGNKYKFYKDYEFSSSSAAAATIVGYSINGRISWKDEKGKTLKQLEEESLIERDS
ncbi:GIY-YIG nuclease family protein [Paenibacillus dendritiformis]|uniref:GIY-YIG nuclease family protein n=2 Tax=Paenibacillus dendritiformis TaxID=130049 RepID=UPI0015EB4FD4|nr:GIY-YIG nuclease family protein [Paenibacillus dendritiformis]